MQTPRKPRVDWDAARAYYVALGQGTRTYPAVAAKFSVSVTTVGKWARRQEWDVLAAKVDNEAAERALAKSVRSLELRNIDNIRVAEKARGTILDPDVKLDPNVALRVLPRLATIEQLIAGEATGRIEVSEVTSVLSAFYVVTGAFLVEMGVKPEDRAVWISRLDTALGGLVELGSGEAAA